MGEAVVHAVGDCAVEAKTWRIASSTFSTPRMLRKVSCWPANEASGRSSAVAEERTAKEVSVEV
jgi:hypothetical protein